MTIKPKLPTGFDPALRLLSHVPRWAIVPTIRTQNVAEHSYWVTYYVRAICDFLCINAEATQRMIWYALDHDHSEIFTGDIPSPTKRIWELDVEEVDPYVYGLTPYEFDLVKIADLYEAIMFLIDDQFMGNRHLSPLIADLEVKFQDLFSQLGREHKDLFESMSVGIHYRHGEPRRFKYLVGDAQQESQYDQNDRIPF